MPGLEDDGGRADDPVRNRARHLDINDVGNGEFTDTVAILLDDPEIGQRAAGIWLPPRAVAPEDSLPGERNVHRILTAFRGSQSARAVPPAALRKTDVGRIQRSSP